MDKLLIIHDNETTSYELPKFGTVTVKVSDGRVTMIETLKQERIEKKK